MNESACIGRAYRVRFRLRDAGNRVGGGSVVCPRDPGRMLLDAVQVGWRGGECSAVQGPVNMLWRRRWAVVSCRQTQVWLLSGKGEGKGSGAVRVGCCMRW